MSCNKLHSASNVPEDAADLAFVWTASRMPKKNICTSCSLSLDDRISSPDDESLTAFDEDIPSLKVRMLYVKIL